MKYAFQFSGYTRVNVWLDEEPPAAYAASAVDTQIVNPKAPIQATRRMAGIELCISHGPKSSYALLAAELIEADVDHLEISVSINKVGAAFLTSLAGRLDEVKIGLPYEYAPAVLRGAARAAKAVGGPVKRHLRFGWAAHGTVHSSPYIFERVSEIVLPLLSIPNGDEKARLHALLDRMLK